MSRYVPFVAAVLMLGGLVVLLGGTRNGWAEFCTTKAYGWPVAMRYDYCLCGTAAGEDPAPVWAMGANGAMVLIGGMVVQGVAWKRGRRKR